MCPHVHVPKCPVTVPCLRTPLISLCPRPLCASHPCPLSVPDSHCVLTPTSPRSVPLHHQPHIPQPLSHSICALSAHGLSLSASRCLPSLDDRVRCVCPSHVRVSCVRHSCPCPLYLCPTSVVPTFCPRYPCPQCLCLPFPRPHRVSVPHVCDSHAGAHVPASAPPTCPRSRQTPRWAGLPLLSLAPPPVPLAPPPAPGPAPPLRPRLSRAGPAPWRRMRAALFVRARPGLAARPERGRAARGRGPARRAGGRVRQGEPRGGPAPPLRG